MKRYQVKIEDSILPQTYSFEQLIEEGLLDDIDDEIKIKQECDGTWITARNYPFSVVEKDELSSTIVEQHSLTSLHPRMVVKKEVNNPQRDNIGYNNNQQETSYGNTHTQMHYVPSILDKWNWGAFALSWIWGVCNGIYWPLALILLNFIPYVGCFLSLAICVLLGFKGNQLAWSCTPDKNVLVFERKQASWNLAGKLILSFLLFLGIIMVMFLL